MGRDASFTVWAGIKFDEGRPHLLRKERDLNKKHIKARVSGVSVSWTPTKEGIVVTVHGITTYDNIKPARSRFLDLEMTLADSHNLAFLLNNDGRAGQ